MGYVVGAEVLWRMCHPPIPWQFAEYLLCFVCGVLLLRAGASRRPWLPVLYIGLLLPASLIPFATLPFEEARQAVSFNLSGPLCLAFCALWCSSLPLNVTGFERLGVVLLGPIGGVAFLGFLGLATSEDVFSLNANFVASGGYGPNQVSALIGLGGLLAVLLYLGENRSWSWRLLLAGLALALLAQSALTFSRTGLYLFTAAFGVAAGFLLQAKSKTLHLLLLLAVLVAVAGASLPLLNAFTGGKLVERFSDTGLTGRDTIANMELQIWQEHPVLGAGAGMSEYLRAMLGDPRPAHTEYTRLLAEHGLPGLGACLVLLLMTTQAFFRARGPWAKAIVSSFAVWAFLFMAASAMRLAAPAFLLGLIQARFLANNPKRVRATRPIRSFNLRSGVNQGKAAGECSGLRRLRRFSVYKVWGVSARSTR
jgi:O-antigen ligase